MALPVFFNLQVTSAYEYLELRFGKPVRLLGSATFTTQMCIYMSISCYAPALALSQVTGINVYVAVSGIFVICIFYTAVGGMRSVMWTDTFQVIIMFGGMVGVIIKGQMDLNNEGISIWDAASNGSRLEWFNTNIDPRDRHTLWGLIIGGYFTWICIYGVNQAQVQRYLCVRHMFQAQRAIWINFFGLTALLSICSWGGLVLYAKYAHCDPLSTGRVSTSDQLFPLFVMETLGDIPGLPGLFVAGIFSGALSTVSSGLNSLSAITLEDFIKAKWTDLSEEKATKISKFLTIAFGVISFALVFVAAQLGGVLQAALSIFGMVGGPLLGVFTLGMFFPWANWKGAFVGTLTSLTFMFWIGFGANIAIAKKTLVIPKRPFYIDQCPFNATIVVEPPGPGQSGGIMEFYRVSYMWYSLIGCSIVIIVGMLVSLFTGFQNTRTLNPDLISPPFNKLMNKILSKKFRKKIGWEIGVDLPSKSEKILATNGGIDNSSFKRETVF